MSRQRSNDRRSRDRNAQPRSASALRVLVPLILLVAAMIVFLPTINYGFSNYDIDDQLLENEKVRSLSPGNLYRIFTERCVTSYYPIRLLSFAVDYAIWGYDPTGFHLTNVIVHGINIILVYLLILRIAGRAPPDGTTGSAKPPKTARHSPPLEATADHPRLTARNTLGIAAMATMLFALHPVVVEPVAWIPGREELLMLMFTLGCFHAHISAMQRGSASPGHSAPHRPSWPMDLLAGLCAAGASTCNAAAVAIPLMVTGYDLVLERGTNLWRLLGRTWFLWAIALGVVLVKIQTTQIEVMTTDTDLTPLERVRVIFDTYHLNLLSLLWPTRLVIIYPRTVPPSFAHAGMWIGVAAAVGTVLLLVRLRRHRLALFGLVWFLTALAPSAQIIPHHHFRADRFLYMPIIGMGLSAGVAIVALARRHGPRWSWPTGVVAVGLLMMALSMKQSRIWESWMTLLDRTIELHPHAAPYHIRGMVHGDLGELEQAAQCFSKAIELAPDFARAYIDRGVIYGQWGMNAKALADFNKAISLQPAHAPLYHNRGLVYEAMGKYARARDDFQKVIELDPEAPLAETARHNIAVLDERLQTTTMPR